MLFSIRLHLRDLRHLRITSFSFCNFTRVSSEKIVRGVALQGRMPGGSGRTMFDTGFGPVGDVPSAKGDASEPWVVGRTRRVSILPSFSFRSTRWRRASLCKSPFDGGVNLSDAPKYTMFHEVLAHVGLTPRRSPVEGSIPTQSTQSVGTRFLTFVARYYFHRRRTLWEPSPSEFRLMFETRNETGWTPNSRFD